MGVEFDMMGCVAEIGGGGWKIDECLGCIYDVELRRRCGVCVCFGDGVNEGEDVELLVLCLVVLEGNNV